MKFWARASRSREIPAVSRPEKTYDTESAQVQMRIMRTHIAAQASELSNIRHAVAALADRMVQVVDAARVILDRQDEQRDVYLQLKHLRDEVRGRS